MGAQSCFGLLHVGQVQLPEVDVQDFDEASLEKFLHSFKVSGFDFLFNVDFPVASRGRENSYEGFI